MTLIENAKVVLENGILFGGAVLVDGDRIAGVGELSDLTVPEGAEKIDAGGLYVGPGFVDIHVHGGGGAMFHSNPITAAGHFLRHGETTVLAALYYDLPKDDFIAAIDRIKNAMVYPGGASIKGFYMEGPYMNPAYGASPEKNHWRGEIRREDYTAIADRAGSLARVWAIAPERDGVEAFAKYVKTINPEVRLAVGHSEADPKEIERFKKYGLCIATHCMNATGRRSEWIGTRGCGPDEACMLDGDMYAEIICDSRGVHVSPELIRLILKTKGINKTILITDSFVSAEDPPMELKAIHDLSFDASGNLSGSRLTMDMACRNLMRHTNCGIAQAFLMASRNPARAIGLGNELGTVDTGKIANLVFCDDMFHVKMVMLNGKVAFLRKETTENAEGVNEAGGYYSACRS